MLAADRPAVVMETKVLKINPSSFADEELAEAVTLIRQGELVSFPTETVYGTMTLIPPNSILRINAHPRRCVTCNV